MGLLLIKERRLFLLSEFALSKSRYLYNKYVYRGLKFRAHPGHVFFQLTADQVLVFEWIAGSCQVNSL